MGSSMRRSRQERAAWGLFRLPERCRCRGADSSGITPTPSTSCPDSGQSANKTESSRSGGRPQPPRLQLDFPVAAQLRLDHQARPPPRRPPAPCAALDPASEAPDALSGCGEPVARTADGQPVFGHDSVSPARKMLPSLECFPCCSGDRPLPVPARGRAGVKARASFLGEGAQEHWAVQGLAGSVLFLPGHCPVPRGLALQGLCDPPGESLRR